MSEMSTADRLAALQARRQPRTRPAAPAVGEMPRPPALPDRDDTVVIDSATADFPLGAGAIAGAGPDRPPRRSVLAERAIGTARPLEPVPDVPLRELAERRSGLGLRWDRSEFEIPWNRVAATGASVVSFAAMVVAMGPLFVGEEAAGTDASGALPEGADGATGALTAPTVAIHPDPGAQAGVGAAAVDAPAGTVDPVLPVSDAGAPEATDPGAATTDGAVPVSSTTVASTGSTATPSTGAPSTDPPATNPPASTVPTTAPPATAAPTTPTTAAPTTAAPTTAAPTTPPPTTAPPTTAPPTTAAPTTQPPPPPTTRGS